MTPKNNQTHFRKLENMYLSAPTNEYFRPKIKILEGRAEVTIDVREDMFHAAGAVHGAIYFKALDDSAFFAANSINSDSFVLTTSFTIYLTRPVTSGQLKAIGQVLNSTKSQFIAQSVLYNSEGKEIARGMGSFAKSNRPLNKEIGYRL